VEGEITAAIFKDAMRDTPRSVTASALKRFNDWLAAAESE
jgi:hypothetical protein